MFYEILFSLQVKRCMIITCASGDNMYFICSGTSQDHLVQGLFEFMIGSPLRHVTTLTTLATRGIAAVEIKRPTFAMLLHA